MSASLVQCTQEYSVQCVVDLDLGGFRLLLSSVAISDDFIARFCNLIMKIAGSMVIYWLAIRGRPMQCTEGETSVSNLLSRNNVIRVSDSI